MIPPTQGITNEDLLPLESPTNETTTNEISPSPVVGKPSKFYQLPKPLQTSSDKITPSPILGRIGKLHHHLQSRTKSTHDSACGCNECFNFQLNNLKQVSVKTISNLISNFIKYKTKNKYGKLENHDDGCMCVDHLIKKHAAESQIIKRLLDNRKEKQKTQGSVPKKPDPKPKAKNPSGTQLLPTTKISRNNVMTSSTPNLPH